MSVHHVRQIQIRLQRELGPQIDTSDLSPRHQDAEREKVVLSRSLAAFCLQSTAHVDAKTATSHVTDGSDDQGIDALFFDEEEQTLVIAQSKWHSDGRGSIQLGDALKTIEGIKQILGDDDSRFNGRLKAAWQRHRERFQSSLNSRIVCYFVYTGAQDLSEEVAGQLEKYRQETNEINDLVTFKTLNLKEIHNQLASGAEGKPIQLEILLREWGKTEHPLHAIYGRVSAADVAQWLAHNNRDQLFSRNIRKILTDSEINDSILSTLTANPSQFWYFNNGITILCKAFRQKAMGAGSRDTGIFTLDGVSIVNGAQTAGAIARCSEAQKLTQAFVQVRVISLENAPSDLDKLITRATNTQNRIEAKDFASLDAVQERLRRELLIVGRGYLIKAGEKVMEPGNQCSIDEAAVALACALDDVNFSTIAKNSVGRIWEEAGSGDSRSIYRRVFPESVDSAYLWNCVQTLRAIEAELSGLKASSQGKRYLIAVNGNRLLAHLLFRDIDRDRLHSTRFDVGQTISRAVVQSRLSQLETEFVKQFPTSYPASVFKNQLKCQALAKAVVAATANGANSTSHPETE